MSDKPASSVATAACRTLVLAGSLLLPGQMAMAETRQALVIALRSADPDIGRPFDDALAVSRAALIAGFDVRRLEQPAVLPAAPADPPDVMLIYLSGDGAVIDGMMRMGPFGLDQITARYGNAGQIIVLAETCTTGRTAIGEVAMPDPRLATTIALSQTPETGCDHSRLTDILTTALTTPGRHLQDDLKAAGLPMAQGPSATAFNPIAAADTALENDGVILSAPLAPVVLDAVGTGSAAAQGAAGVRIFNAAAPTTLLTGDRLARPTPQGLPEPSVIVGLDPPPADASPAANSALPGQELSSDFEDRERLRAEDPALFDQLLASGALDPAPDQIATIIQADLLRMNCYSSVVDGIWGNGSRSAVDRYFNEAGRPPPSREPDAALFRAVASGPGDLRCPAPAAQPAAVRTPLATTTARRNPAPQAARTQATPRREAPTGQPAAGSRQINPNALGSGAFR